MAGRISCTAIMLVVTVLMLQWRICVAQPSPSLGQANAGPETSGQTSLDTQIRMVESCRDRLALRLKIASIDQAAIKTLSDLCNWEIFDAYGFAESDARLAAFSLQREQGTKILWIVEAMTLVGLLLAIVQLAMSFVLAIRFRKELIGASEVRANAKEVVLKSSAIGLALLAITFAFFLTYVLFVYPIREVSPHGSQHPSNAIPVPNNDSLNVKGPLLPGLGHLASSVAPASSIDPPARPKAPASASSGHAVRRRGPCSSK